jgi:hypothetical protein
VGDYSFGFQAQEKDDEMWGGSVTYKYRVEDPRLGRFFSVDPLYAKYPWNSNYAFSENKTIAFGELEGLESFYAADGTKIGQINNGSTEVRFVTKEEIANVSKSINWANHQIITNGPYVSANTEEALSHSHPGANNMDDAAKLWGSRYNSFSIIKNKEFGSTIYKIKIEGKTYYNYSDPNLGDEDGVNCSRSPLGTEKVADIHSHASYDPQYENNEFSIGDKESNERSGIVGYVSTPNGSLLKYDPKKQSPDEAGTLVNDKMPSDEKDPSRKNQRNI